jgi:hypothetical protein
VTDEQPVQMQYEIIDSKELAKRWSLHHSWIRYHVSRGAADPIPHVKLGKYVRFEWGSEPLQQWWNARRRHGSLTEPAQKREDPGDRGRRLARQVVVPRVYGR